MTTQNPVAVAIDGAESALSQIVTALESAETAGTAVLETGQSTALQTIVAALNAAKTGIGGAVGVAKSLV